ncbi:MAG: hypothetical protein GC137_02495 [Alphaproteobacteria bacterium]|nr:hypothetical protein [Alphaproteobacteria bacterium]
MSKNQDSWDVPSDIERFYDAMHGLKCRLEAYGASDAHVQSDLRRIEGEVTLMWYELERLRANSSSEFVPDMPEP